MIRTPERLIKEGYKIFVDTNVFMHTDSREDDNLKNLVQRVYRDIITAKNPIVITTKVVEELNKHSLAPRDSFEKRGRDTNAIDRAQNALRFINSAKDNGLFRTDLGDKTNPYADDTFVEVFKTFGNTYNMCLITNDITLLLRIRELNFQSSKTLYAGTIARSGEITIESDRELLARGKKKLDRLDGVDIKAQTEKAELSRVLGSLSKHTGISLERGDVKVSATTQMATNAAARNCKPAFKITSKLAAKDSVIQASELPSEGDTVIVGNSSKTLANVKLGPLLGAGGEGSAYLVSGNRVVKIYDREHITEHRAKKINALVEKSLSYKGICFPTGVVLNRSGQFVGYIMPKAEGREFSKELFNPRRFRKAFLNWKKADLIDVCIKVLEQISFLHNNGIILGDINPKNLLVTDEKNVYIIDADSWQIEGYPCPVGTPMFTAPEIQGLHYPDFLRTLSNENFAVATLLFQIMITGQFPYARMGFDGDIAKSIKSGEFAFQWKEHSNKDQPKGNWKYMWSHLNPRVKEMFWNTFHKNGTTHAQTKRPSVDQWLGAFKTYRIDIRNDFDPMSNDVYPTRFRAFRKDTPIYKCKKCGASMCGIWQDDTQEYYLPELCTNCKDDSVYRAAPRVTANTVSSTAGCKRCKLQRPKSDLYYGTCSACRAKENQLDMSRRCTTCGNPFLTYGHVWWHQDKYKTIPTSHKRNDPNCRRTMAQSTYKVPQQPAQKQQSSSSWCYVATYVYGTYDCPELWILRRFRDTKLKKSVLGRIFIKAYYWLSPSIIRHFGSFQIFNTIASKFVYKVVSKLKKSHISEEEYFDE
jgi:serine/threonine protein kinase/rRNA-processing protein FCF1